jgi:hypothetical protein
VSDVAARSKLLAGSQLPVGTTDSAIWSGARADQNHVADGAPEAPIERTFETISAVVVGE